MATAADWLSVTATLFSPVSTDGSMLQVNFDANKAVSHPSFNANVSAARVEHTTHLMRLEAQEIGECLKNHLGGQENLLDCHHQHKVDADPMERIPKELRHLRACLLCSMIKTLEQFDSDGCDNCERYLHLKGDKEQVLSCTSSNFDGVVSMINPEDSWVAKWQRIDFAARALLLRLTELDSIEAEIEMRKLLFLDRLVIEPKVALSVRNLLRSRTESLFDTDVKSIGILPSICEALNKLKPGCYAVSVSGKLPPHIVRDLKLRGINYRSRDNSSVS